VQPLPSSHADPLPSGAYWQPEAGLQESVVHAFPSSHENGWCTHSPVDTSQPSVVQASLSLQLICTP